MIVIRSWILLAGVCLVDHGDLTGPTRRAQDVTRGVDGERIEVCPFGVAVRDLPQLMGRIVLDNQWAEGAWWLVSASWGQRLHPSLLSGFVALALGNGAGRRKDRIQDLLLVVMQPGIAAESRGLST